MPQAIRPLARRIARRRQATHPQVLRTAPRRRVCAANSFPPPSRHLGCFLFMTLACLMNSNSTFLQVTLRQVHHTALPHRVCHHGNKQSGMVGLQGTLFLKALSDFCNCLLTLTFVFTCGRLFPDITWLFTHKPILQSDVAEYV